MVDMAVCDRYDGRELPVDEFVDDLRIDRSPRPRRCAIFRESPHTVTLGAAEAPDELV